MVVKKENEAEGFHLKAYVAVSRTPALDLQVESQTQWKYLREAHVGTIHNLVYFTASRWPNVVVAPSGAQTKNELLMVLHRCSLLLCVVECHGLWRIEFLLLIIRLY